ncbi:pyroglutamylated RFamide peptide receptor-like [Sinocyclocheilus grahami]|uniref:pyroglutamylated RFamide peptide receptor-like n=1 Tax=Sinocyclocheilus grahami TaxID=75366 RepID=UPI0007ACA80E|nr:PREDICTED: pyroglutamylated RFamide peptide receptor-like [Sinocyclocheilus grahami]
MEKRTVGKSFYSVLGVVWIAAMMVGSPMLFVQQLESVGVKYDFLYDLHHVCCQECWSSSAHRKQYATFILVFLFLLPLAAMLLLYTRIGIELWIHKQVGDASVLNTMNQREKRRAVKMMVTIVVLFTVCWAPFHTVHMLFEYSYLNKTYGDITVNMLIAVAQAIGFSNSFNNPIIYAFMNENFQKNCMSTFSFCIRRSSQRDDVKDKSTKDKVLFCKSARQEEDISVVPGIHIVDQVQSARSNMPTSLSFLE